ncbi:hypothetical protein [Caballeronia sp. LZ034LL]|uniref:hypothetical protein n=1 Tax=Caballeronia sp. LZ034LL TaxID=3038567 RepID=UPI002859D142|nr:hypothetical protein [Caballeronia sp. LZ034LL]MDR5833462.1 hypothetical protein [Caballeronia sp. LZ034LL]
MNGVVRRVALIVTILIGSYYGAFHLAHWINDVLIAPGSITWLFDAVLWFRNHFAPMIVEPDDIEALYLLGLFLMCWLGLIVFAIVSFVLIRRGCARPATDSR